MSASGSKWRKGLEEGQKQSLIQKCLQERVCELFLMQDYNNKKISNNNNSNNCPISSPPPFFRSPTFLNERIPQGLFSNGTKGLLPNNNRLSDSGGRRDGGGGSVVGGVTGNGGSGSVVRNIPIRVLDTPDNLSSKHQREQHQQPIFEQQSSSLNTPERMDLSTSLSSENNFNNREFSPISSPDLRRQFSSLFWTPQQAKRIAERENSKNIPVVPIQQQQNNREFIEDANHYANSSKEINNYNSLSRPSNKHTTTNSSGFGNGSTVTFYSIPISQKEQEIGNKNLSKNEKEKNGKLELSNNNLNKQQQQNVHYSAIPFRRRIGGLLGSMSAISTPSLFHQREDEEDKPKSHYQNIDFNSDKNNKLIKEHQQFNRPSNLSNNKSNNNGTITTSQTTFPTNSNKLINETKHQQTNCNNNNNFPLQHLFRRNQTSEKPGVFKF
uniref:Uncharacterized protein n=1 Tax=Meloidogyne incognita TaxID=6306 RepID=A0A914L1Y8_MELIC